MFFKGGSILMLYLIGAVTAGFGSDTMEPAKENGRFGYADGVLLGIVEGLTEYLPVSSTGHLILTNRLLGLDSEVFLMDENREFVVVENDDGTKKRLTMGEATRTYAIVIQLGAILAVVFVYWQRILSIALGLLGKDRGGLLLSRNLTVAFLPSATLGLLLEDFVESVLFGVYPVAIALFAGGILMLIVARRHPQSFPEKTDSHLRPDILDLHSLTIKQCLTVGCLQCVALWPGMSRSMMTIVGGYWIGLRPARAAEFSFLLGLVTLSSASIYKALSDGTLLLKALPAGPALTGILAAAVSAALAVKWFISFLTRYGLSPFAWYRIGLAVLVLLLFA